MTSGMTLFLEAWCGKPVRTGTIEPDFVYTRKTDNLLNALKNGCLTVDSIINLSLIAAAEKFISIAYMSIGCVSLFSMSVKRKATTTKK